MNDGKTAIILVGGGMKSAHGAGFLYALAMQLDITNPSIMIGTSGNAGNLMYFCAGQYESLRRVWTELLSTPRFISFLRFWRIMNINYLVDTVFRHEEPLSVTALRQSPVDWRIPIMNFDTGVAWYVGCNDDADPFEVLRAAKALPFLYGTKVRLHEGRYTDGEFGTILEDHIAEALRLGASRILILNHLAPWLPKNRWHARLYALFASKGMRRAIIRDISTSTTRFDIPEGQVLFVNPEHLPASTATRSSKKLRATFERGYADALSLEPELRVLFGDTQ